MPLPPFLLSIFTHTLEGAPMKNPTWGLLDEEAIDFLVCACEGTLVLGEQESGHYLVDPADIGLNYQTCKAYNTARDQYTTLASEADMYSLTADSATRRSHLAAMNTQEAIRNRAFQIIDAAAFTITEAHRTPRSVTL